MKTAIIIAGGEGSRLMPLTKDIPKTLVEVGGKPMLQWVLEWLKTQGIEHLVIGVAYKKEKIFEFMKKNSNFGFKVDFSEHTLDGGTAEAFRLAITRFVKDEEFLAMNSDELTNMSLKEMEMGHKENGGIATMAIAPFHCRFSIVKQDQQTGEVTDFEYGKKLQHVPVSIGIYIFNRKILESIPNTGSIETETFARLAGNGNIFGYMLSGKEEWVSVNTQKDIKEAEAALASWGRL